MWSKSFIELKIFIHMNYIIPFLNMSIRKGRCQQIKPFYFYSIYEFRYIQLVSRSKYFVGMFEHIQSKVLLVVKQIPYCEQTIDIIRKIDNIKNDHIISIIGACIMISQFGWLNQFTDTNLQINKIQQNKNQKSVLLFMQKYDMNLHQYITIRRRNFKQFTVSQINDFINELLPTLECLERNKIAHRDIKPQNILINQNHYYLCDFEDAIELKQKLIIDLTTIQYSSPQFLRNIRHPKDKYFDPFKLDVYSFGLTLLYLCSMGKFRLDERTNYIYQTSQKSYNDFMKDERRKWIKNYEDYKIFNSLIKLTLEQDQYKRDDFIMLSIKIKDQQQQNSEYNLSDDNSNSKSSAQLRKKQQKSKKQAYKKILKYREFKIYGLFCFLMIIAFLIYCIL